MTIFKRLLTTLCSTCQPSRSSTVRYAFPLVLSTLVILGALTITSKDHSFVEVVPSKTSVRSGEQFEIDVYVTAHKPVNAVDIELAIPQSQLDVAGIDVGESVITLWTEDPYYKNGTVYISGGTFRRGFLGRHLIATVNVRAKATGLASVNVTDSLLLAGDGTGSEVESTPNDADEVKLYIASEDGTFYDETSGELGSFSATAEISIVTDIDGDGDVTLTDISRFMTAWQSRSMIFDFNADGTMTFTDFAIILAHSFFR